MAKKPKGKDAESKAAILVEDDFVPQNKEEGKEFLYQTIGSVSTLRFFASVSDVTMLMKLNTLKKSKVYKAEGLTWAQVCDKIGVSRRTIDEKLSIISEFAEEFFGAAANFIGPDFNKIRALRAAQIGGSANFTGKLIEYNGESVEITKSNQGRIDEILQKIVDDSNETKENNAALERLVKGKEKLTRGLSKKLAKFEKRAEELGLDVADEVFMEFMDNVRTGFDGWAAHCSVAQMEAEAEEMTPSKRAALLSTLRYMKDHSKILYEEAVDKYGQGLSEDDKGWSQPSG